MFRCPHCTQRSIPRWRGAICFPRFPATCPRCGGRSKHAPTAGWLSGATLIVPLVLLKTYSGPALSPGTFYAIAAGYFAFAMAPYWFVPLVPVRREDSDHIVTRLRRHWLRFRRRGPKHPDEPGPDYFL